MAGAVHDLQRDVEPAALPRRADQHRQLPVSERRLRLRGGGSADPAARARRQRRRRDRRAARRARHRAGCSWCSWCTPSTCTSSPRPFNVAFARRPRALGALLPVYSGGKPVDFEDPGEEDRIGRGAIEDFTWKGLLDFATCTECGRCQSQCPAWNTGKPLSPQAARSWACATTPWPRRRTCWPVDEAERGRAAATAAGEADARWSATGAASSTRTCCGPAPPAAPAWSSARSTSSTSTTSSTCAATRCSWSRASRAEAGVHAAQPRARRRPVGPGRRTPVRNGPPGLAFEVRVARRATDPRRRRVPVLGGLRGRARRPRAADQPRRWPNCCTRPGCSSRCSAAARRAPATRPGASATSSLFQKLAQQNVETLNGRGRTKIVATCAHCFNTLANEYPQLGGTLRGRAPHPAAGPARRRRPAHPGHAGRRHHHLPRPVLPRPAQPRLHAAARDPRQRARRPPGRDAAQPGEVLLLRRRRRADVDGGDASARGSTRPAPTRCSPPQPDVVAAACPYCVVMLADGVALRQQQGRAGAAHRGDRRGGDPAALRTRTQPGPRPNRAGHDHSPRATPKGRSHDDDHRPRPGHAPPHAVLAGRLRRPGAAGEPPARARPTRTCAPRRPSARCAATTWASSSSSSPRSTAAWAAARSTRTGVCERLARDRHRPRHVGVRHLPGQRPDPGRRDRGAAQGVAGPDRRAGHPVRLRRHRAGGGQRPGRADHHRRRRSRPTGGSPGTGSTGASSGSATAPSPTSTRSSPSHPAGRPGSSSRRARPASPPPRPRTSTASGCRTPRRCSSTTSSCRPRTSSAGSRAAGWSRRSRSSATPG